MFENSYLLIIVIGLTSLSVVLYYNQKLKNLLKVLSSLIKLQSNQDGNIQDYIRDIEYSLKEINIKYIFYNITYQYKALSRNEVTQYKVLKKEIKDDVIHGYISIVTKNNRGENRIINRLVLYVVTLQIINAIHTNINTINKSFERIAKLQTYMMHDLKNVLQFFQAMQYNIDNIQSDEEKRRFIEFLQTSTKPINKKVNKILALLKIKSKIDKNKSKTNITIEDIVFEYISYFSLDCKITGKATIHIHEEYLRSIFDNILGNIKDKQYKNSAIKCSILIKQNSDSIDIQISDTGEAFQNPNIVCEPFYTTKEEGIGIGMYQVATLLELLGGSIKCLNQNNTPNIYIKLPIV